MGVRISDQGEADDDDVGSVKEIRVTDSVVRDPDLDESLVTSSIQHPTDVRRSVACWIHRSAVATGIAFPRCAFT